MGLLGSLVSAVGSLIGGRRSDKAAERAAERNAALQKEFAQNGIQWKVADAKKAGIHPLYALGASTISANPVYTGAGDSGISDAAAAIGRGISAKQQQVMANEKQRAELDLIQAQADKVRSDMILNMKKASDASLGRQALRTKKKVPNLYIKVYDNLRKRYVWMPNVNDVGVELPESVGGYYFGQSFMYDNQLNDKNPVPDWALQIKARRSESNWDPSTWITYKN